jgi:aminoglycoside phosphotransferase (APT) family kinase protein
MSWIEGVPIREQDVSDWRDISGPLTEFLAALHVAPTVGGPAPGRHKFGRGVPLALRDMATRDAIGRIGDLIDARTALAAWEHDARQPEWQAPPRWIHGDLHAHNLLARAGRLCAVIDFGGLGVGDPACDLAVAWRLLPAWARSTFKGVMQTD